MDKKSLSNLESSSQNMTTEKNDLDDLSNNIPERIDVGDVSSLHNNSVEQDQSVDTASEMQSDEEMDEDEMQNDEEIDEDELYQAITLFKETLLGQDLSFLGLDDSDESLKFQEDTISWFAQELLKQIFEDLDGDVFSLLVEESSEISKAQQMAMVIRYVDKHGVVKERFIGLVPIEETCALSLKSAIDDLFARYNLSLNKMRGQCYDIASYMDDKFHGLRALISKENPSAYYVHWFAKELQLVVVVVAEKQQLGVYRLFQMVESLMDVVCESCTQQDMVRESQKERLKEEMGRLATDVRSGLDQEIYPARVGDTCSNSRYKTLTSLVSLYPSVLEVLDYIYESGKTVESKCQADKVYLYLITYEFVFYIHLMMRILEVTDILSQCLQKKDQDLFNAISFVNSTKLQLQNFRSEGFDSFLEKVNSFCEEHDIEMVDMSADYIDPIRRKERTGITYFQYYKFECFNKVLDGLIRELENLFSEVTSELLMCMGSLSPCDNFCEFDIPKILRLAEMYPYDFDDDEKRRLKLELLNYIDDVKADTRFANLDGLSTLVRLMVETKKHLSFPLVYRLLKLSLVLPVATASVERSFFAMKAGLHNRFGDEYSNDISICYLEKELLGNVSLEDVIDHFE